MNNYFKTLLSELNDKLDDEANDDKLDNKFDNEANDGKLDNKLDNEANDGKLDNKLDDEAKPQIIIHDSQQSSDDKPQIIDDLTHKHSRPLIIYSFIYPLFQNVSSSSIYDLKKDLNKIIKKTHRDLNDYATSDDITEQILSRLHELIQTKTSKYKIFLLPVTIKSSPFNLFNLFSTYSSFYSPLFINPSFSLILKQIINNYHNSPYRTTINECFVYILYNYQQTKKMNHSILYSSSDLKHKMLKVKSAFISEADFTDYITTFNNHIIKTETNTPFITFKHLSDNIKVFDVDELTADTEYMLLSAIGIDKKV